MLVSRSLWMFLVLFLVAGFTMAEQPTLESEQATRAQVEPRGSSGEAPSISIPYVASFGEGPLDPGGCDDCAGGCQYTCTNHSDCQQQCPNGIGSCNQLGTCLCACVCNYDGCCEFDEEDECPDCQGVGTGPNCP